MSPKLDADPPPSPDGQVGRRFSLKELKGEQYTQRSQRFLGFESTLKASSLSVSYLNQASICLLKYYIRYGSTTIR